MYVSCGPIRRHSTTFDKTSSPVSRAVWPSGCRLLSINAVRQRKRETTCRNVSVSSVRLCDIQKTRTTHLHPRSIFKTHPSNYVTYLFTDTKHHVMLREGSDSFITESITSLIMTKAASVKFILGQNNFGSVQFCVSPTVTAGLCNETLWHLMTELAASLFIPFLDWTCQTWICSQTFCCLLCCMT